MADKQFNARIRWKRDTSANWTSNNPVLLNGEIIIVDTDSGEMRFKIGDGVKTYTQLPFEDEVVRNLINNKVDKVDGKGLSTNDYDTNTKTYIDDLKTKTLVTTEELTAIDNAKINKSGGVMTGALTLADNPTEDLHAATKQYVDSLNSSSQNTWYGTCTTAAATAAKVVTTTTGDFTLKEGATVYVLFNTAHTSTSRITLNVDGTGDIAVNLSSTNGMTAYQIAAKQVICFVYDGESFRVQGGSLATTTYYGLTKLSSSTSSTSTTMAATPSAVKEAYDLAAAAVSSSDIIDVAHGGTGRSTIADTEYTTAKYRASALVTTETDPTDNGVIYWVYA